MADGHVVAHLSISDTDLLNAPREWTWIVVGLINSAPLGRGQVPRTLSSKQVLKVQFRLLFVVLHDRNNTHNQGQKDDKGRRRAEVGGGDDRDGLRSVARRENLGWL